MQQFSRFVTVRARLLAAGMMGAMGIPLLQLPAAAAPGTPIRLSRFESSFVIRIADPADMYALLGLTLGMTPDAVIAVAKAAGWKVAVRQAALPSNAAFVSEIEIAAPFPTQVEFSAVTGNAVRISARSQTVEIIAEQDALYQAAVAKWGAPLKPRGEAMPAYFEWEDRHGIHPTYTKSLWDTQRPGSVTLADEPARKASQAFLAQPGQRPKPSL